MAAYGLYTHIQSNKRRSIALLIGLFFLVYLLVYAGALVGEALTIDAPSDVLLRRALSEAETGHAEPADPFAGYLGFAGAIGRRLAEVHAAHTHHDRNGDDRGNANTKS